VLAAEGTTLVHGYQPSSLPGFRSQGGSRVGMFARFFLYSFGDRNSDPFIQVVPKARIQKHLNLDKERNKQQKCVQKYDRDGIN